MLHLPLRFWKIAFYFAMRQNAPFKACFLAMIKFKLSGKSLSCLWLNMANIARSNMQQDETLLQQFVNRGILQTQVVTEKV
jgi:hypothetical protein